jgi:glutathione S-transferase
MLELYHHNISVCAQKVRLSLVEKGLAWEGRHVDLMTAEQVSPAYLALNPRGVVPTIVHDGLPIIESTIILEYLEDAFPDTPLRPDAPGDRARMRLWTRTPDDGLHAACGTLSYAAAFAAQVLAFHGREALDDRLAKLPDRARAARQNELFDKGLEASFVPPHVRLQDRVLGEMETALSDRPWLAGADFSIAECAMLPYLWRLERLNLAAMWADRPNVADWFARAKARPSWDAAMEAFPSRGEHDYDDDLRSKGIDPWPRVAAMLSA